MRSQTSQARTLDILIHVEETEKIYIKSKFDVIDIRMYFLLILQLFIYVTLGIDHLTSWHMLAEYNRVFQIAGCELWRI